jgi:anaerobic ribonucleoside-triphosphate reductase
MQNITKRDGTIVPFDKNKIINALKKAFSACAYTISDDIIEKITSEVRIWDDISVEDIQDQLEELLMDYD